MRKIVAIAVAVILVAGCVTPMIPLPPPSPTYMSLTIPDETKGVAQFLYSPSSTDTSHNGAYFFVFNEDTGKGIIQQADASGAIKSSDPIVVKDGHRISVWVQRAVSEERSDITNLVVDYSRTSKIRDVKE